MNVTSKRGRKVKFKRPTSNESGRAEGYVVLRDVLAKTKKVAIGQLIMHGREHHVGITAHKKGLMPVILRYEDELRKPESFFDKIPSVKTSADAAKLAVDLIEKQSGRSRHDTAFGPNIAAQEAMSPDTRVIRDRLSAGLRLRAAPPVRVADGRR